VIVMANHNGCQEGLKMLYRKLDGPAKYSSLKNHNEDCQVTWDSISKLLPLCLATL